MFTIADNDTEPTITEAATLVRIDRCRRLLEDTIQSLECGGNIDDAIADLRAAHELVAAKGGGR